MPFTTLPIPTSPTDLPGHQNKPVYLAFIASPDPVTQTPWCPSVQEILPILHDIFSPSLAPEMFLVEVGQKAEWKAPNAYREKWNVAGIPMLVKYESVGGEVKETGRLDEDGIKDEVILGKFIGKQ